MSKSGAFRATEEDRLYLWVESDALSCGGVFLYRGADGSILRCLSF